MMDKVRHNSASSFCKEVGIFVEDDFKESPTPLADILAILDEFLM
jgi:hypothetical protein